MHRPRSPHVHPRLLAFVGLVALFALGPLGCTNDDVADGDETGGDCSLLAGDLVISEIVANVAGDDEGLEWFEIYNASGDTIDLEGLILVYEKPDGSGRKTHVVARSVEVPAGGYVVVGSMLDELAESSDHVDYGYGGDLGQFGNTSGYLGVECDSDTIDGAYYEEVGDAASRSFDGSQAPDAIANDTLSNWCDSRTPFGTEFAATPGAANDVCGSASTCGDGIEIVNPVPGELVITEVMPNPDASADMVGEWFEIHSLATGDVHLNGVQIGKSVEDEAEETIASADCIVLSPGDYAIVVKDPDPMINGGLPSEAIVWTSGISLTNNDGSLWLGTNEGLLDAVSWASAGAGEAIQLDPDFFDPTANDDPINWCDATEAYGAGDLGTPGGPNGECFIEPPAGQCYDNGELRDIMPLEPGDLEIVEFMANPDVVDDADGEWFELSVKASGDLNGLQIGKAGAWQDVVEFGDAPAFAPDACITVSPGDHVVFAHEADPMINGGLPAVDVIFDMALNNSGSDLIIGYGADPAMPDEQTSWSSVTAGAAMSKDSLDSWCDAVDPYGPGDNLGTPGSANPLCEGGGGGDMCLDPDTMLMRTINTPTMADVTISEIMPNPSTAEPGGEWFELHFSVARDLNGLQLGKNDVVSHTISDPMCLEIPADSYVVFARSDDGAMNCMLGTVDYVYDGLALSNSDSNLQIGHTDVVLSEYTWTSTNNGVALSYDPLSMTWCDAVDMFGCGDLGTPGAENPECGGGNMMMGQCIENMMPRDIVAPMPGDLVITEFMANPAFVADADGEWFEVRALAPFDLNGLELGRLFADGALHTIDSADCISLMPGETALLAVDGDPMINGGLPAVDYVFSGFGLSNSNSALHVASAGMLLDEITWTSVAAGRSTNLDPDLYDPNQNDVADNGVEWCYVPADLMYQYGGGDYGTPDADNIQCN